MGARGGATAMRAALVAAALAAALGGCTVVTNPAPKPSPDISSFFDTTAAPLPVLTGAAAPGGDAGAKSLCRAAQLAASVDAGRSGEASGIAHVVIALRNTGTKACLLQGVPGLTGDGAQLPVFAASDAPYRAGSLAVGARGFVRIDEQLKGCTRPLPHFARLGLVLDGAAGTVALPWPAALGRTGCVSAVTAAGLG